MLVGADQLHCAAMANTGGGAAVLCCYSEGGMVYIAPAKLGKAVFVGDGAVVRALVEAAAAAARQP